MADPADLMVHKRFRNAQVELFGGDEPLPCVVADGAAVVGGHIVKLVTGGQLVVSTAGEADAASFGLALHDVDADDKDRGLGVAFKGVWYCVADGAITSGQTVEASATGEVQTRTTGRAVGVAVDDATDGQLVPVLLNLA